MSQRVILDLCAGSGAWSNPYVAAGYDVRRIDLPTDVRLLRFPGRVYGILAAPPCTMFCRMRMCRGEPTQEQFREALSVVDACLRLVAVCRPDWWALENPQGYLTRWLGPPQLRFHPYEYGDPWTKRTWVWGNFRLPLATAAAAIPKDSWVRKHGATKQTGIAKGTAEASRTPSGFAQAFFEANRVPGPNLGLCAQGLATVNTGRAGTPADLGTPLPPEFFTPHRAEHGEPE